MKFSLLYCQKQKSHHVLRHTLVILLDSVVDYFQRFLLLFWASKCCSLPLLCRVFIGPILLSVSPSFLTLWCGTSSVSADRQEQGPVCPLLRSSSIPSCRMGGSSVRSPASPSAPPMRLQWCWPHSPAHRQSPEVRVRGLRGFNVTRPPRSWR